MVASEDELVRQLHGRTLDLKRAWARVGIDLRGIAQITRRENTAVMMMGAYITSPGSRARFDDVVQKLGHEWTLEALAVDPRFSGLFNERVLVEARSRLGPQLTGT